MQIPEQNPMDTTEYRTAKARSGVTVSDIWNAVMKITKDQDKAYSSGRTAIPDSVAAKVRAFVDKLSHCGRELADVFQKVLPDCAVNFNDSNGAITLTFPSTKSITISCAGVDAMNLVPVYVAARSTKNEAIFIFFDDRSNMKLPYLKGVGVNWFLWRGDFPENRNMHRLQNYFNKIEEPILTLAFRAYA